ncbi:potassium channel subfamily K member 2-like isoform X1 [Branchiostoma floridae]|uniref:Potassium channel subfamily K member 2-like isoform X1 n=1 Tax=Branchiostoma floridae TaxID=7739 RepID=A0A9J7KUP6_BRAFL|nr:potassium channel subfamily K member 2-like isoform X1 [Branchiostoma floridae]
MNEYIRLLLLFVGLFTYMFIGAGLFHALEPGWIWDDEWGNITDGVQNVTDQNMNDTLYNFEPRSYMEAFYFCATVITTIGYGHIYPVTGAAKFFTAIFANFGIPAFFYILAIIGRKFANLVEAGESRFFSRVPGPYGRRTVTLILVELLGLILFILIPAAIISTVEGWSYGDATWYLFVSVSTIGFGDLYGGYSEFFFAFDATFGIYVLCKFCYCIIGLSWVATMWILLADVMPDTEAKPGAVELVNSDDQDVTDRQGELLPPQA